MKIYYKAKLEKLKNKNVGNSKLISEINELIKDIEQNNWKDPIELKKDRPDADIAHSKGFYFFNIKIHRTLILIEFDEKQRAFIIWAGSHQDYEKIFKNNKKVIEKWLKDKDWL